MYRGDLPTREEGAPSTAMLSYGIGHDAVEKAAASSSKSRSYAHKSTLVGSHGSIQVAGRGGGVWKEAGVDDDDAGVVGNKHSFANIGRRERPKTSAGTMARELERLHRSAKPPTSATDRRGDTPEDSGDKDTDPHYSLDLPLSFPGTASGKVSQHELYKAIMAHGIEPKKVSPQDADTVRFGCYFVECVATSPVERHRVRHLVLYFHTLDGTLAIYEPHEDNSGIWQGPFLARHRARKSDGSPVTVNDFSIGGSISLYGRNYHIAETDEATRSWYRKHCKTELKANIKYPPSEYYHEPTMHVPAPKATKVFPDIYDEEDPWRGFYHRRPDTRRRFLDNVGKVLLFDAEWDDTARKFGDKRKFLLKYFLADETVEILEIPPTNSGRDPVSKLLARQRLPLPVAGEMPTAGRPTSAPATARGHHTSPITGLPVWTPKDVAPVKFNAGPVVGVVPPPKFLSASDIRVGNTVDVYGRTLTILRCDDFTANWYKEQGVFQGGMSDANEVRPPIASGAPAERPHTSHSTRSTSSMLSDYSRFQTFDGKVLRFGAELVGSGGAVQGSVLPGMDREARRFVISFYLGDDTLSIYELPSDQGLGGRFLDRGKYAKAESCDVERHPQPRHASAEYEQGRVGPGGIGVLYGLDGGPSTWGEAKSEPTPVSIDDLRVGNILELSHARGQRFRLTDSDDFTTRFLEGRAPSTCVDGTSTELEAKTPAVMLGQALDHRLESAFELVERVDQAASGMKAPLSGLVSRSTIVAALSRFGVSDSLLGSEMVFDFIESFCVDSAVRYNAMFDAIRSAPPASILSSTKQAEIRDHLCKAMLASRTHLRKVVRDMGLHTAGAISPEEFRHLLRRHTIDTGLTDADVRALMSHYEPSKTATAAPGSIDLTRFLLSVCFTCGLTPQQARDVLITSEGVKKGLEGAGVAPGMRFAPGSVPPPPVYSAEVRARSAPALPPKPPTPVREAKAVSSPSPASAPVPSPAPAPPATAPASTTSAACAPPTPPRSGAPRVPLRSSDDKSASTTPAEKRTRWKNLADPEGDSPVPPRSDLYTAMSKYFRGRRYKLLRTFQLYDAARRGRLGERPFIGALQSAGFRMSAEDANNLAEDLFPTMDTTVNYNTWMDETLGFEI